MSHQRIVFLGPPASGKGTAAQVVSAHCQVPHVSTGQMFRDAIRKGGPLSEVVRQFIDKGQLVPDELTVQIVRLWLDDHGPDGGFIFDGFPRTLPQAEAFDRLLAERNLPLTLIILMEVKMEEILGRILGRLSCEKCGALYHAQNILPQQSGICDKCGGQLIRRHDDTAAILHERMQWYETLTIPVVHHYESTGLLRRVNASGLYERGFVDILELLPV
ncbi:MAG: adenylate kinase [Verrucomicrobiae bacterium]|nr:adenylate kinase [Verrucomicrobiae bacterium]